MVTSCLVPSALDVWTIVKYVLISSLVLSATMATMLILQLMAVLHVQTIVMSAKIPLSVLLASKDTFLMEDHAQLLTVHLYLHSAKSAQMEYVNNVHLATM